MTPEGLEEQLLGTTVTHERPDLANMKNQLVLSNARMKKELKDIEDKILFMLSNSQVPSTSLPCCSLCHPTRNIPSPGSRPYASMSSCMRIWNRLSYKTVWSHAIGFLEACSFRHSTTGSVQCCISRPDISP